MKCVKYFLVVGFALLAAASFSQSKGKKKAPNIILILSDDQGWSQSSVLMDPRVPGSKSDYLETPNLVRLASEGMRFSSGYAPAPICTPTRRSILCGTSAPRSGEEFPSDWVPSRHITIPRMLKKANPAYRTAHIGKWGGKDMISTPAECGYDVSSGVTGNPDGDLKVAGDRSSGVVGKPAEREYFVTDDPKSTDLLTNTAIDFMQKETKAGNPFYLQVSYYAVHLAVIAREKTIAKYTQKGTPDRGYTPAWAAMLDELDAGIGRLLETVDKLGIADNTYIIFTSDNGGRDKVPGGIAGVAVNSPLDGAKQDIQEGGIRVPFIVRGPGVKAGSVCNVPVAGYDFLPTFYAIAGGRESLKDVDGGSILPLLNDPVNGVVKRAQPALFFSRPENGYSAVRQGDYKLMVYWDKQGNVASRKLFNFNPNPAEEGQDIAANDPKKADELQRLLIDYLRSVDAKTAPSGKKKSKED